VDYLVFTPVITNKCPNRRTFSAPVIALAGITATAGIPAPDDHHHHPRFAEPRPLMTRVRTRSTP